MNENGGVFVSIVTFATVISFAGLLVALAGGFGWMIRRMDTQFARLDDKIEDQGHEFKAVEQRLTEKIEAQTREITEVKIAVARLEGPRPHIISAR